MDNEIDEIENNESGGLKMNIELTEEQKIKILNSSDVYMVIKQILMRENKIERDFERVYVVCLASNNTIINIELISLGAIDETVLKPMQVFRIALIKGACKLILVHNHPNGDLVPSEPDKDVTDQMIQVGNIVNVKVLDHLIITEKYYFSFKDDGLMDKLSKSTKWVPTYIEIERIKKEALKLGEKKGRKEGLKEGEKIGMEKGIDKGIKKVAKTALKKGTAIDHIAEITGLSIEEIKKLR
jgi:DNA repair protein RadC